MTTREFSNEFDILYNSIATKSAPGIDIYEKSVYLTKAQLEIVKNYFTPQGNKYQKGFENTSKRRNDLNELIRNYKTTLTISSNDGIDNNSKFFRIPSNVFLIVQEKAKVISSNQCLNNAYIKVVPKTHDEYNRQIKNPFKKPDKKNIWRMDYYSQNGSNKNIELISEYQITEYACRYVVYPSPIILGDLLTLFPGENLSIDNVSQEQTCKLSESIHREILDRAVELALADYKPEKVQLKAQMNLRNE
jgi:hypothetical protein